MAQRLLTTDKLLPAFKDNLRESTRVDIASAWATEGGEDGALAWLERWARNRPRRSVRAIVGLWRGITTPDALRTLDSIGKLRLVDRSANFHPKVFVFHKEGGKSVAWVGSANFTGGGFGQNEEVVLETGKTKRIVEWFDKRWKVCGALNRKQLKDYCRDWCPPASDFDERLRASRKPASLQNVAIDRHADPVLLEFWNAVSAWRDEHPKEPLEEAAYHPAVLLVLHRMDGSGPRREVLDAVRELLKPVLRNADYQEASPSRLVWESRGDHARANYLVSQGFLQPVAEAGRGRWILTPGGKDRVARGDFGDSWRRIGDGLAT